MHIAIQGEPGSFSHEAAGKLDIEATILPCSLSSDVFRALSQREVDAAVIPIENSLAGSVVEHYDLLLDYDVAIESESLLRIRHNFIVVPGVAIERIQRVYSHPVALAQCRKFLEQPPAIEAIPFYDTAGSAKQLMELRDRNAAAIASARAAEFYGGEILAADIEDNTENYTRFFLVWPRSRTRRDAETDMPPNKISIAFSLENRPGSLVAALSALSAQGTNLTKIESRPVQGKPWEYIFYVDCQIGGSEEGTVALEALRPHCGMVKELGRYREARAGGQDIV